MCVPVMAYIYLPVAFIYLLPAAIFFWLSKDLISFIAKKFSGLFKKVTKNIKPFFKLIGEKFKSIIEKISSMLKPAEKPAEKSLLSNESDIASAAVDAAAEHEETLPVEAYNIETDTVDTDSEETATEDETGNFGSASGYAAAGAAAAVSVGTEAAITAISDTSDQDHTGEQMTIEESAEESAVDEATEEKSIVEEAIEEEPVVEEAADEKPDTDEAIDEEPAAEETVSAEPPDIKPTITRNIPAAAAVEREPADILGGLKRGFSSFAGKLKNMNPARSVVDRKDKDIDDSYNSGRQGGNQPGQAKGWTGMRRDTEKSNIHSSDVEYEIKKQFDNLDMITTSAIAIMLSDTKTKAASPYIKALKKPDIRIILLKFCKDSFYATDIEQLNSLFSKSYYKWKITRYMGRITVFIKRGIGDSLPRRIAFHKARSTKNRFINKICETINTFESVKYISALSGNEEISDSKRNYKLDHLSDNYKDAMIYLVDSLLTCTCVAKMLFVERMIRKMDENSEFNKIITNMAQSIDNHNLIINKSRPIYKQYYQSELGYLNGDDLLYGMAITIMVNRVKKVDIKNTQILQINTEHKTTRDFKQDMQRWLDELARGDAVSDVGTLILQKITLSIKDNYGLLTNALQELTNWENYYSQRVTYYKKEKDRERYLIGDFEKEKEELIKIR